MRKIKELIMKFSRFKVLVRINIIKTMLVNFKHFGITGFFRLPIILQYGSKINGQKGSIVFTKPLQTNMLLLKYRNIINIEKNGKLITNGTKVVFNFMNTLNIGQNAVFEVGHNFVANGQAEFNCRKRIRFGDDCLISVHTMFLDTDFHPIYHNELVINQDKEITIGHRVWIGCNVTILKGTSIGNDIVIGAGSTLCGKYLDNNSIYTGNNPARKIKDNITWKP